MRIEGHAQDDSRINFNTDASLVITLVLQRRFLIIFFSNNFSFFMVTSSKIKFKKAFNG
jgi:hypothetical protein